MLTLNLGPLALPPGPLLLIASWLLASWLGARLTPDPAAREAVKAAAQRALWAGVLAARLAHVMSNLSAYSAHPWSMLDVRDGGWSPVAGAAAALLMLGLAAAKAPAARRGLAAAAAVGGLVFFGGRAAIEASQPTAVPAVRLLRLDDGRAVSLTEAAAGRPMVLNLWASWCPPCREEMPHLAAAQAAHPGVAFVFVNQGESAEVARAWMAQEKHALREVLMDPARSVGTAIGSRGLPTTVFYDAQGRRVAAHVGVLSEAALAAKVRQLQR